MKYCLVFISFLCFFSTFSQNKRTISGFITSENTGEKLIGAVIYDTVSKQGALTNEYGFFSLTIPSKDAYLRVSYFGMITKYTLCALGRKEINISLSNIKELEEVTVTSEGSRRNVESSGNGTIELQLDKLDKIPMILGEKDVLRMIQLLPGVKSGGEASSGIYVRGGGPDQNLILLDGVPVYNTQHLFGFFSVFNSDALSNVTLIKGGFPARYGGRASSVLDMRMKEGNMKNYNVEGSISSISSRILVEGPIKKDKTSFAFSARRSYLDLFYRPFLISQNTDGGFFFHDFNAKIQHKINDKHHIYLSGYFGLDKLFFKLKPSIFYGSDATSYENQAGFALTWGNSLGVLRWNYKMSPKLFMNTTATFSDYKFDINFNGRSEVIPPNEQPIISTFDIGYYSGIRDWNVKSDFTYFPNPDHHIKFGVSETYHTFSPGISYVIFDDQDFQFDTIMGSDKQYSNEISLYFEDDFKISDRLKINYGVHNSIFIATTKTYNELQPRFSGNFMLDDVSSIKFGATRMAQFLHLLTNSGIGLPSDLWVPTTDLIKPITANQFNIGYHRELSKEINFSFETYYKKLNNIIQYKEGSDFINLNNDWQDRVTAGQGWTYGGEIFIEKRKGRYTGWLGYTLSWSQRQFDSLNFGEKFYYRYDRRHDLSLVISYDINDHWDLGIVFVYGTGNAVTIGSQNYSIAPNYQNSLFGGGIINNFEQLNNYRMPAYHRLDFAANYKKDKKWGHSVISMSIYNVYNRQNPFILYTDVNNQGKAGLYQLSLFPFIPSVAWKFKFDFEKIKNNKQLKNEKNEK
jgi:hypothetical protein